MSIHEGQVEHVGNRSWERQDTPSFMFFIVEGRRSPIVPLFYQLCIPHFVNTTLKYGDKDETNHMSQTNVIVVVD